jgi:hypothetical protein
MERRRCRYKEVVGTAGGVEESCSITLQAHRLTRQTPKLCVVSGTRRCLLAGVGRMDA